MDVETGSLPLQRPQVPSMWACLASGRYAPPMGPRGCLVAGQKPAFQVFFILEMGAPMAAMEGIFKLKKNLKWGPPPH